MIILWWCGCKRYESPSISCNITSPSTIDRWVPLSRLLVACQEDNSCSHRCCLPSHPHLFFIIHVYGFSIKKPRKYLTMTQGSSTWWTTQSKGMRHRQQQPAVNTRQQSLFQTITLSTNKVTKNHLYKTQDGRHASTLRKNGIWVWLPAWRPDLILTITGNSKMVSHRFKTVKTNVARNQIWNTPRSSYFANHCLIESINSPL